MLEESHVVAVGVSDSLVILMHSFPGPSSDPDFTAHSFFTNSKDRIELMVAICFPGFLRFLPHGKDEERERTERGRERERGRKRKRKKKKEGRKQKDA